MILGKTGPTPGPRPTITRDMEDLATYIDEFYGWDKKEGSMKHTPGPWRRNTDIIWSVEHGFVCQLSDPHPFDGVLDHLAIGSQGGRQNPDWDEAMANGRLIIAAPELLTATCETIEFLNILLSYVQHMSLLYIPIQARRDELQRIVDEVSSGE